MNDGNHALRSTSGGRTVARLLFMCVNLALLSLVALVFAAGCASEADLTLTLQTTEDPIERQKAAAELALMHSPAATQRLVSAAATDATAAEGLVALRDEYVLFINSTIEKARAARAEFKDDTKLALLDAVNCLAAIGDVSSVEVLGDLVCETERTGDDAGSYGRSAPDTLELQLRALDAIDAAGGEVAVEQAALRQLLEAASLKGEAISTVAIRDAAMTALVDRPEAVDMLFQARVAAKDDEELRGLYDGALAQIGEPAVETLVAALAEQDWTDEILSEIGAPAVDAVVKELDNDNGRVRYRALGILLRLFVKDDTVVRDELVRAELVPLLLDARLNATYGDERDGAAEAVLALIGEPAVEPVMALLMDEYWAAGVLAATGEAAVPALTAALGSDDRDLRFKAADVLVEITNAEPESVVALTADLEDENLKSIAANYAYYIRLGRTGTEEILAKALNKHGDKDMALDYLNCGNEALDAAAREWAANHGYEVYTQEGVHGGPQWGEGN